MKPTKSVVYLGLVLFLLLVAGSGLTVTAQEVQTFTSETNFALPQTNGSIHFAYPGNCTQATQEDDAWVFTNLTLSNAFGIGAQIPKLTASTQNSDITVYFCQPIYFSGPGVSLRYFTSDDGFQAFNFGMNLKGGEWMVTFNTAFPPDNTWHVDDNGTISVNAPANVNVSISYYVFGDGLGNFDDSDKPFYLQHSVVLVTIGVVIATLIVAGAFAYNNHVQAAQKLSKPAKGATLSKSTKSSIAPESVNSNRLIR